MKRRPSQEKSALRRIRQRIELVILRTASDESESQTRKSLEDLITAYRDACRFEDRNP